MTSSSPPPPFDEPTLKDPLECPPLRWGILGCGRVSHDFVQAMKHIPNATVVACAARDLSRAQEFAHKHAVAQAYDNYDDLLANDKVEVVVRHSTLPVVASSHHTGDYFLFSCFVMSSLLYLTLL